MSGKAAFTPEEWEIVSGAPFLAGAFIMKAAPSGLIGLGKEVVTIRRAIDAEAEKADGLPLVKDLHAYFATKDKETAGENTQPEGAAAEEGGAADGYIKAELGKVVALLDSKIPAGSSAFRRWLYDLGVKVSEASKEGGFLGIGGTTVSKEERAALDELAALLNVTA